MRKVAFLLLFLISCTYVSETPAEPTQFVQVFTDTLKENKSAVNVSKTVSENISAKKPTPTYEIIVDLTIAQQHKMIPLLEEAVKKTPCYGFTWEGIENQNTRWILEVKKEMRFDYLGEKLFKGWILYTLWFNREQLESETVVVMVDDLDVNCTATENFVIDWERAFARYPEAFG